MNRIQKLLEDDRKGLDLVFRSREDLDKFKKVIDMSDFYGEDDATFGIRSIFFEEEPENYDALEGELQKLLDKAEVSASIEGR